MTNTSTPAGKASLAVSAAAVVIGFGTLAGWAFHVETLKSVVPGITAMNPATAILFILAGTSLILALQSSLVPPKQSRRFLLATRLCALVVALTGLAKFIGYLCGKDLPLDQWLFAAQLPGHGHLVPNRMSPESALNFFLLGGALFFVERNNRLLRSCLELFVAFVAMGAFVAFLGHLYHIQTFFTFGNLAPMPFYTGAAFLVMAVAYFLAHTDAGLLAVFVGKSAGGVMARKLLPTVVLIPAGLGWLILEGQEAGFYSGDFGNAVFAVANIFIFIFVISWSAKNLFHADMKRQKAEEALRSKQAELRILFDLVPALIYFKDTKNNHLRVNKRVAESAGKSVEEIEGTPCRDLYPLDADKYYADDLEVIRSGRPKLGIIERKVGLEGRERWVHTDKVPYFDNDGKVIGVVVMAQDVTERIKGEENLRLLNSAVLQSEEAVLITEAQLELPGPRIIFVNPAFTEMTGYTAGEVIGKTPRILQGPLTDKEVLSRLRKNLEQGEPFEGEAVNYRKDGTPFDLEWKIAPLRNPAGQITHFVAIQRDITKRKRNESRFRRLVESNAQGVLFWNRNGKITGANDAFLKQVGYTREDLEAGLVDWIKLTPPEYAALDQRSLDEIARKGSSSLCEKEYIRKDGSRVPILYGAASFEDNPEEGVCFTVDLTKQKKLEQQLFQAQKLETVGKLAGGVAHEFNSILTAIIGQSELLLGDLPPGSPLVKNATEINNAAGRAAILTTQLLAYGRKQILDPEHLDLTTVLNEMKSTLQYVVGPQVDVRICPAAELKAIQFDAGQIEQVIMNIALNARDAMPRGGKLTLETANVSLDADTVGRYPELKPGDYVMLAIADTGMGMTPEVQARIFEPFFSTKDVGQGTGLGLSTCYGIIKQSGGHIGVYSQPGRGSTFKIYLPQVGDEIKPPAQHLNSEVLPRGVETILLVEDDPALREMSAELLGRLGYKVLTAGDGIEALRLKQQKDVGHIDLLFTDVIMPHMNGKELAERIRASSPHTKVLFSSAYTENAIVHQGVLDDGVMLLQKPFAPSALATKVRTVLDQTPVLAK